MFVNQRMTSKPVTISSTKTITEAAALMKQGGFRRLPVVDIGRLVGIITDRDLRKAAPSPATALSAHELNYLLDKVRVKDIMTKQVATIDEAATIEEAALLMYNHRIGGLVVVNKNDAVVGVITETDIFKCFVDIMGLPDGTTRFTIDVSDQVGVLHDLTGIFADLGANIRSLASYALPNGSGYQVVIRTDSADVALLKEHLTEKGYQLQHIVQIG